MAQLSLAEILSALPKAVKTPADLQMIYDTLGEIGQKQLECLGNHNYVERKYAAEEQPVSAYSVASSSPAYYTPAASSLFPITNNLNPLEAQQGSGMRAASVLPLSAMRNP